MSPTSSIPEHKTSSSRRNSAQVTLPSHSRNNSAALQQEQAQHKSPIPAKRIHYTTILRFPFSRPEGFSDPSPVEWDSAKDRTLWKVISKASNSRDLDWEGMAERFGVDLGFLLMQAAWLYERHFEGMKMQMLRLGSVGVSGAASPTTLGGLGGDGSGAGSVSASGIVKEGGGRDSKMSPISIATAAFAGRRTSPSSAGEVGASSPGTPRSAHPPISRTPSTTTVTQSRLLNTGGQSQQQPLQRFSRGSSGSSRRPPAPIRPRESSEEDSESALGHDDSDSDESEDAPSLLRSQAFRRPALPKKGTSRLGTLTSDGDAEDEDNEDDSSEGYLPFAGPKSTTFRNVATRGEQQQQQQQVPASVPPLRNQTQSSSATTPNPSRPTKAAGTRNKAPPQTSETSSAASSSLTFSSPRPHPTSPPTRASRPDPGNARPRTAMSPGQAGSEDSPSMGSSFSDLDVDASVTQSALEDALLSHMQRGGSVISRVGNLGSTIGQGVERFRRG